MTHPILRPVRRASPLAAVLASGLAGCAHVPDLGSDDASATSIVHPDGRGDYAVGNPVVGIDGELHLCLSADTCNSGNELLHAPAPVRSRPRPGSVSDARAIAKGFTADVGRG